MALERLAAALGIRRDKMPADAQTVIAAMLPSSTSHPPERGAAGMLTAYNNSPWVRAIASRISTAVGAVSWQVYAARTTREGRYYRNHELQEKGVKRDDFKRRALDLPEGTELIQLPEHPVLGLLSGGSYRMPGSIGRQMTQLYLELTGEAFWLLEPRTVNGATVPVAFWVIPPTWVQDIPQTEDGVFVLDTGSTRSMEIPAPLMVWFANPNPVTPYSRGVGHMRAFGDEIDTEVYTAKYIRAFFYNSARPDLLVYGKDLQREDIQRLEYGWLQKVRGFLQSHKPFFLNRDVTVKELTYKFQEMQLIELRKWERDILVNGRGVPPEVLGIIENSNRATIDAADYLFAKGVVEPALEFMRTMLQADLMPLYDNRLILGYNSPVGEDWDFALRAMQAAPFAPTINEWRAMQGLDTVEGGDVHVFQLAQQTVDLDETTEVAPAEDDEEALVAAFRRGLRGGCKHEHGSNGALSTVRHGRADASALMPPMPRALGSTTGHPREVSKQIGGTSNIPLAERLGKQMMDDLLEAWEEIRSSIDMDAFIGALAKGDLEAAIAVVERAPMDEALEPARQTLREALYVVGAAAAEEVAEALGVPFSFDVVNPAVIQELEQFGAGMVTNVSESTKAAIRAALVDSYSQGKSASKVAKEIRGLIGLTERDARLAVKRREELLSMGFTEAQADAKMEKWIAKKIAQRAELIANNELVYAANRGQEMVWEAAEKAGLLVRGETYRMWIASGDERTCDECQMMQGELAPLGGEYKNGFYTPNDIHIACRCTEALVFMKGGG